MLLTHAYMWTQFVKRWQLVMEHIQNNTTLLNSFLSLIIVHPLLLLVCM